MKILDCTKLMNNSQLIINNLINKNWIIIKNDEIDFFHPLQKETIFKSLSLNQINLISEKLIRNNIFNNNAEKCHLILQLKLISCKYKKFIEDYVEELENNCLIFKSIQVLEKLDDKQQDAYI